MAITTLDSNQARNNWRDLIDTARQQDTHVIITHHNKPVVAVVAYEDYLAVQEELQKHRAERRAKHQMAGEMAATMIASERVLSREWDTPEEDEAWSELSSHHPIISSSPS